MTPQQIIAAARRITNDKNAGAYRTADDELLEYINDFLKQLCKADPSLSIVTSDVALVAGELQKIDRLTHNALVDVLKNADGTYVKEIDLAAMEVQFRTWRGTAQTKPEEWARLKGDPWGFMVFPPATAGTTLQLRVATIPADVVSLSAALPVSDNYRAAAAHYLAGRVLFKNTNSADTERGQALIQTAAVFAGISNLDGQ